MNYSVDLKSIKEIEDSLQQFQKAIQKKIIRKGLRRLGNELKGQIQSNIQHNSKKLKKAIKVKVKSYKRGSKIWMGVGIPNSGEDDWLLKLKAHAYDSGWRPYPKGRPTQRKGKGWRKGLRRLGGDKIWKTQFITKVYKNTKGKAEQLLKEAIDEVMREFI